MLGKINVKHGISFSPSCLLLCGRHRWKLSHDMLRRMSPSIIVHVNPFASEEGVLSCFLPLRSSLPFSLSRNAENMCSSRSSQKTAPRRATGVSLQQDTFHCTRYSRWNNMPLLKSFGHLKCDISD